MFIFRAGLPYTFVACFGDAKIAAAYYKIVCTLERLGFFEVWRGLVWLAVLDQCLAWEVIVEPVVELHGASLNCTVYCGMESTEDQSCVYRLFRFWAVNIHVSSRGRYFSNFDGYPVSHERWIIYSSVDICQPSLFWRFANRFRLWILLSRGRWTSPWYVISLKANLFSRASTKL